MLEISPLELARYTSLAHARWQGERIERDERRQRAWRLARQAAELLRVQYGVRRVVVFGSLTHPDRFTQWSDVDLAAWGLTSSNWLRASAAVRELARDIELNLADVACCASDLLAAIERDGVPL